MAEKLRFHLVEYFDTDSNSEAFLWQGGVGVLAVQGNMDSGVAVVQFALNMVAPIWGSLEDSSGSPVQITGLANSDVRAIEFSAPQGLIRINFSGSSGSADCRAGISMISRLER